MKQSIFLIRHAESAMNIRPQVIGGRSNEVELTPLGIDQSRVLGKYLIDQVGVPANVYSSPAIRTLATARFAFETMKIDPKITVDERLLEMDQGDFVGRERADVYIPDVLAEIERQGKDFKLPGGESMNDVGVRMKSWLDELPKAEGPVYVFSHGVAIRCLVSTIEGWSRQKTFETPTPNTSITRLDHDSDGWRAAYVGKLPQDI